MRFSFRVNEDEEKRTGGTNRRYVYLDDSKFPNRNGALMCGYCLHSVPAVFNEFSERLDAMEQANAVLLETLRRVRVAFWGGPTVRNVTGEEGEVLRLVDQILGH